MRRQWLVRPNLLRSWQQLCRLEPVVLAVPPRLPGADYHNYYSLKHENASEILVLVHVGIDVYRGTSLLQEQLQHQDDHHDVQSPERRHWRCLVR